VPGPQGPTGAAGPASSAVTTGNPNDQNGAVVNDSVSATATCPAGKILLGGGGQITTGGAATITDEAVIIASYPSAANVWTVTAKATVAWAPGHHLIVTAYVVCST
jgi:hypothetical protein